MPQCPKCGEVIGQADIACEGCGYDFPWAERREEPRSAWAYSRWADATLLLGQYASFIAAVIALLNAADAAVNGPDANAPGLLLVGLICAAMFVLIARTRCVDRR